VRRREAGGATLATALIVLLAASLLGAAVAEIARTELVVAESRRTLARGLAAGDACLARAVATLPAGWDQAAALAGADGVAGTGDDGVLAAPAGCVARLVPGPLGAMRPFLDVAVGVAGGGRRLRAIVGRSPAPVPALVWTESAALGTVVGAVTLDGTDPARPDLAPLAAVATPDDPTTVDAWFAATPGVGLIGATPAPVVAPAPPLPATRLRLTAGGALPTFAPSATPPVAGLAATAGDLAIVTPGFGAGVLHVDGRLDIQADFAFSGIVAARGGVVVASGATFDVRGGLWLGVPSFDVAGHVVVRHDRAAIDAADALFTLPRPAVADGVLDR
jgi:hypothetical protein